MTTQMDYLPGGPSFIPNFHRYHALAGNWTYSAKLLTELRARLRAAVSGNIVTVAVAGSLGRLEASSVSDADFIVIADDIERANDEKRSIDSIAQQLGLRTATRDGVFSLVTSVPQMLNGVGGSDEDLGVLARRLLMLLESRPVLNDEAYGAAIDRILGRYAEQIRREPNKQFVFLLNDLIRYFRAICVNYQSNFWRENEKWPLRNLKLRHSRVVMYAGLLFLLGAASKPGREDRIGFVRSKLMLTPLDRIAFVYEDSGDDNFFRIAGLYDVFLARVSEPSTRESLRSLDYHERYGTPIFSELKSNSDALISELLRFTLARRGSWSDRFFEYLIF